MCCVLCVVCVGASVRQHHTHTHTHSVQLLSWHHRCIDLCVSQGGSCARGCACGTVLSAWVCVLVSTGDLCCVPRLTNAMAPKVSLFRVSPAGCYYCKCVPSQMACLCCALSRGCFSLRCVVARTVCANSAFVSMCGAGARVRACAWRCRLAWIVLTPECSVSVGACATPGTHAIACGMPLGASVLSSTVLCASGNSSGACCPTGRRQPSTRCRWAHAVRWRSCGRLPVKTTGLLRAAPQTRLKVARPPFLAQPRPGFAVC